MNNSKNTKNTPEIAARFKMAREAAGLSARELTKSLALKSASTITKIEKNLLRNLSDELLDKFCEVTGAKRKWLETGGGSPVSSDKLSTFNQKFSVQHKPIDRPLFMTMYRTIANKLDKDADVETVLDLTISGYELIEELKQSDAVETNPTDLVPGTASAVIKLNQQ